MPYRLTLAVRLKVRLPRCGGRRKHRANLHRYITLGLSPTPSLQILDQCHMLPLPKHTLVYNIKLQPVHSLIVLLPHQPHLTRQILRNLLLHLLPLVVETQPGRRQMHLLQMTLSDPGPRVRHTRRTSPPRITLLSTISQLQVLPLHRIPPGRPQLHITGQVLNRKTRRNLRKARLIAGTTPRRLATKALSRRLQ